MPTNSTADRGVRTTDRSAPANDGEGRDRVDRGDGKNRGTRGNSESRRNYGTGGDHGGSTDRRSECDDGADADAPVRRATRIMRLVKLAATTLAALAGAAKALGLV
ncbi:hypothetical protein [Halosimplex halophilum]|uniref:hypothetical protein n=1 Tax=Halosimplex halophilum TaxID=2559572 RepID=UPI00107F3BB0|nr:hypothetical protein [Halosimplex halophilum]